MATRPKRRGPSAVQEARNSAIRGALVTAATEIAGRDGLQGVTIRGVAQEAGCSVSSVYAYFEDRDAILVAVVDASLERSGEAIRAPLPPETSFEERLEALLGGLAEGPRTHPRLALDLDLPGPDAGPLVERAAAGRKALLRGWIERNATPGDLGGHTTEEAAETLFVLTRCFGALSLLLKGKWEVADEQTREVIRAVLAWARGNRGAPGRTTAGGRTPPPGPSGARRRPKISG